MLQVWEGGQEKFCTPNPRDVQVLQAEIFSSQRFENFSPENKGLYLQDDYLIFRIKIFLKKSQTSSSRDMKSMLKIEDKTCLFICCCNMSL